MPRIHERASIFIDIVLESSAGRRESRISDISMGGCYIESITNFREGEEIFFDLKSVAGEVLRFSGTVAYVHQGLGFGLMFTNLTPDHVAFLNRILPNSSGPVT